MDKEKLALFEAKEKIRTGECATLRSAKLTTVLKPLENIQIKYNPAAFALIRYFIMHFEFISAIFRESEPLFGLGTTKSSRKPYRYEFEPRIDYIRKIVRNQKAMTGKFCKAVIFPKLGLNAETFKSNDLCFRHMGKSGSPLPTGEHQIVRVVTSHIDYIDKFRLHILKSLKSDDPETWDINRRLCKLIGDYSDLLADDREHHGGHGFAEEFQSRLDIIEKSVWKDTGTPIRLS